MEVFAQKPKDGDPWDVAVVGSGPAGLTAAIYTTRGAASTIILAGDKWGGQLMLTTTVDNYSAMPGIQGPDLMQRMKDHSLLFGAEFLGQNVTSVNFSKNPFQLQLDDKLITARSAIIATGADTLWLGVPGEKELIGKGISSCAPCDAPFFKEKIVAVVGGGDAAMEEALVLTKYASSVVLLHRRHEFKASKAMQQKVFNEEKNGKIKIMWNTEIVEYIGKDKLEKIVLRNSADGTQSDMPIDGVFVAIGHVPASKIFNGHIELDERGYVKKVPIFEQNYSMSTSVSGVFVAGDVHDHHYRQAITSAGFGCMAGIEALKFLDKDTPTW